jgi:hypothetical protein
MVLSSGTESALKSAQRAAGLRRSLCRTTSVFPDRSTQQGRSHPDGAMIGQLFFVTRTSRPLRQEPDDRVPGEA